ncbi:MAG TPA: LPS assembly protein LptD [Stellaceae bacterium]|jgi:LPS-assembly protein
MCRLATWFLLPLIALAPELGNAAAQLKSQHVKAGQEQPYLFSADQVEFDQDLGLIVAKGHVEISQGDQVLLADTVTYNQHTDTATASGHVSVMQPSGEVIFADYAELHDNFKDGFVKDVRILMSDRSRLAGNTARRVGGTRLEIRRSVYSPCDLCKDDPTKAPVWQVRADRVVDDKDLKIVEYYNADMEIDGVPVMWTPYFSMPDPSVKRASGFLPAGFGYSSSLGFHAQVPYYWVISPDKDMVFAPLFTSNAGVVLVDQYRERFSNGYVDLSGSVGFGTPQVEIGATNVPIETNSVRGHFFGSGEFDLSDDWRATFNVQRTSDLTYLLRYSFRAPQDYLSSYATIENFGSQSYLNISAMGFQSLLPGVPDSVQPYAAPVADYMYVMQPDRLGGQLVFSGNAVDLISASGPAERRLSAGATWVRPFDGLIGDRFQFQGSVRGDGYYSNDIPNPGGGPIFHTAYAGRAFPQAALTWRYPWVRRSGSYTELIEPVVMGAMAPTAGNYARIPNGDSQAFDFNDTDLFVPNRFSGFDLVDTGSRVDYGLRGGIYADNGTAMRFVVGQSYAFQTDTEFLPGSGLTTRLSDVVGRITLTPIQELNLIYRFRLAENDLAMRVQEIAAQLGPPRLNLRLSYTQLAPLASFPEQVERKEAGITLAFAINEYWSADIQEIRDFSNKVDILSGAGVTYRDECLSFTTSVGRTGIQIGDVKPGISVLFTFVFKNLGEFGLHVASIED